MYYIPELTKTNTLWLYALKEAKRMLRAREGETSSKIINRKELVPCFLFTPCSLCRGHLMGLPDPRVGRKESTRTAADRAGSYPARPADRLSSREVKSVSEYLYSSSRHCLPLTISPSPAMEEAGDVLKFEELDDALDDWGNIEEIKEGRDCTFGKIYGPIRALFASDLPLLEKFGECKGHSERLEFLLNMQVCK